MKEYCLQFALDDVFVITHSNINYNFYLHLNLKGVLIRPISNSKYFQYLKIDWKKSVRLHNRNFLTVTSKMSIKSDVILSKCEQLKKWLWKWRVYTCILILLKCILDYLKCLFVGASGVYPANYMCTLFTCHALHTRSYMYNYNVKCFFRFNSKEET